MKINFDKKVALKALAVMSLATICAVSPDFVLAADTSGGGTKEGLCELIESLGGVFKVLRVLAFVGAAFFIAGWAWEFISGGKVDTGKVKDRGIALIVGFSLLFLIGIAIGALLDAASPKGLLDCKGEITAAFGG